MTLPGPLGVVLLNLGGPDSPEAVEPFLRNLFADPEVIQLGWASFLQPLLARMIARRRAPLSRAAYAQIGGRSPIRAESEAQAAAVAQAITGRGVQARPYVAMACWHPFSDEAVAAMRADGVRGAVAVPLFPHHSRTTTGSSFLALDRAAAGTGIEIARVDSYPDAPGYVQALCDCVRDAIAALPAERRTDAPVLFSAHGLPEAYIRRGDRYLDEIRTSFTAVTRALKLGARAQLCFQSRVGRQKWLGPYTEEAIDRVAEAGHTAVVICPLAFTGEHIETLQEIDILYRERASARGIQHFSRARTVGVHPAFIDALATLALEAAQEKGWA
jgi:protoporphyrin/coproporphyrin ferrochelatase